MADKDLKTAVSTPSHVLTTDGTAQGSTLGYSTIAQLVAQLPADTINTITEIAAALKSGADGTLITGTAGTNGNLAEWNIDGDAVDSSLATSDVVTASSTDTFTNKTFDANGVGNSLSNVETADVAAGSKTGADATLVTGTAGTSGDLGKWDANGDLVDGPTPPSGTIVGTTDSQALTNKTLDGDNNTISNLDIGNEVDWAAATDVTDRSAFASGDKMLIFEAGVGMRKIDYDDLPGGGGDAWGDAVDADIVPDTDGSRDLGSAAKRFAEVHADTLEIAGSSVTAMTGADANLVTGTAGTNGNLAQWDANGDAVDSSLATADVVTGSSTDTLTNKTIDGDNNTISNLDLGNEVDWAVANDVTDRSAFASGDKVLIFEAGVGMRKVDYDDLPGAGGGLSNIVEDTTPQLGGQLDVNGNAIGDGTNELLTFVEDASAVNNVEIENEATGSGPIIRAVGDDTDIDLHIASKGSGNIVLDDTVDLQADSVDAITEIAAALKSGADGTLVTGTAGTNQNLIEWDANGDAIDSGIAASAVVTTSDSASTSASGIVELATTAETNTGTDTGRALTPDGLAGSNYGTAVVTLQVFDDATDVATGDGAGDILYRIPSVLNGFDLVDVEAYVQTAGTTGTTDIQIHNVTDTADMLSTKITIDSTETDSDTAAAPPAINTSADDVATGDKLRIDVDAVSTTAPKGLWVELQFRLP